MAKKKELNIKFKPIEVKAKEAKELEAKKTEEKKEQKENEFESQRVSQFSESILTTRPSREFIAPVLRAEPAAQAGQEGAVENLEQFAARAPPSSKTSGGAGAGYVSNAPSYAPSAYEKSEQKKYAERESSENIRPVFGIGRDRRAVMPEAASTIEDQRARMAAAKSAEQAQISEFARQQEKYVLERSESASLPFERKRRKTEIF